MKIKTRKSYKAKQIPFKVAVIEKGTTLKQLAEDTDSGYQTIIQIAARSNNASELRAKAIAKVLDKDVKDIFEQV